MKQTRRKLTRTEVDEIVIREALDDAAWEAPIEVPAQPWAKRVAVRRLDLAAKFHVLSVLYQLGADAAFSIATDKDVDITLVRKPGEVVTIDVKVASRDNSWKAAEFPPTDQHFVVFVVFPQEYPASREAPSTYVASSRDLHDWAQKHKGSIDVDKLSKVAKRSRDAWQRLLLAA